MLKRKTIAIPENIYNEIKAEAHKNSYTVGNFIAIMFTNYYKPIEREKHTKYT